MNTYLSIVALFFVGQLILFLMLEIDRYDEPRDILFMCLMGSGVRFAIPALLWPVTTSVLLWIGATKIIRLMKSRHHRKLMST
jgi:hypothetical protein